jgi:5-methyltetrahydropteroyltriglutamate--homocysteine methyltransferase
MNHFVNLTDIERAALLYTYKEINEKFPNIKIILATL